MKRILLDECSGVVDASIVSLTKDKANYFLKLKEILDDIKKINTNIVTISITDDSTTIKFFEGFPKNIAGFIEDLNENPFVEIPDNVDADFDSLKIEIEKTCCEAIISETGIEWVGELVNFEEFETDFLTWNIIEQAANELEPKNNSGRARCWWCGEKTHTVPILINNIEECPICKK